MSFVKLDTGILDSTLWLDRDERDVFVTALLMAEPMEVERPLEQLEADSLEKTGFVVPIGWYGFIRAAGPGIVRRALVAAEDGIAALRRLGSPDPESRTPDHEGRRLVRVDGGYLVLNFMRYRDRDNTAAERAKRYRERQKELSALRSSQTSRDGNGDTRDSSLADADADADADLKKKKKALERQAARFDEFWAIYPVKKGKDVALAKWKARGLDAIADRIIADVKARIKGDRQWLDGYAPHGSKYVHQKGWEDEIQPPRDSRQAPGDIFAGAQ